MTAATDEPVSTRPARFADAGASFFRTVVREARDYPATALLCASWILVFAAIVAAQYQSARPPTLLNLAVRGVGEAHRFGDLTLRDLANGELWRLMTCNFVHYSLVHIGMNLFAFYILGTLLESWYGSWQLTAIYCATGVGGNLLSAVVRHVIGSNPAVHSGGGSVVIMGLIGLCATASWRSRSMRDLTWQMVNALAITAILGIAFPRYIDNWGHAGGAVVGLPLGLLHRRMLARRGRPAAWGLGVVCSLTIAAGALAQARADRREAPARLEMEVRARLDASIRTARALKALQLWADQNGDPRAMVQILESTAERLDRPPTADAYRRLRALAVASTERDLAEAEKQTFRNELSAVQKRERAALNDLQRTFWDLRRGSKGVRPGR